jgi:hypothetical protein
LPGPFLAKSVKRKNTESEEGKSKKQKDNEKNKRKEKNPDNSISKDGHDWLCFDKV